MTAYDTFQCTEGVLLLDSVGRQRRRRLVIYCLLLVVLSCGLLTVSQGHAAPEQAQVVFLNALQTSAFTVHHDGRQMVWHETATKDLEKSDLPQLGSLWKVFFYTFAVAKDLVLTPYVCADPKLEDCSCGPVQVSGGIDLQEALIHSCEPAFLMFKNSANAKDWQEYWQQAYGDTAVPIWLSDFDSFAATTRALPEEILFTLSKIRQNQEVFDRLRAALALVPREGTAAALEQDKPSAAVLLKTFTMGDRVQGYHGGFAGWLDDATLVWVGASHRGAVTAETWFAPVREQAQVLFGPEIVSPGTPPVCVGFLQDYPLRIVKDARGMTVMRGRLSGSYTAITQRGSTIVFTTRGQVTLSRAQDTPVLSGCFTLEDYIARVVQREGDDLPIAAKKALAITARTYLLDEAKRDDDGSLSIHDDSRKQRVSLTDPSHENLQIAQATQGLVLSGPVLYHLTERRRGTLTVNDALRQAESGLDEAQILQAAFPAYKIIPMWRLAGLRCDPLVEAAEWLAYNLPAWKSRLAPLGADLTFPAEVCRSRAAQAYYFGRKVYVPSFVTTDDQLTVVHEWLHGAFAETPLGGDDVQIEALARELVMGKSVAYEE